MEEQTTKVKRLKEDIQERQGKSRAELEAELAQEAGALSGMQVPCQPACWHPCPLTAYPFLAGNLSHNLLPIEGRSPASLQFVAPRSDL